MAATGYSDYIQFFDFIYERVVYERRIINAVNIKVLFMLIASL
jgi:hypothetical protein